MGTTVSEYVVALPGHVRGYDVRTGKTTWTFHTVPQPGEFGYDTWPPDAYKKIGGANSWAGMVLDSFHFSAALPAYKQGLIPTSFGTDLHYKSMNSGMKDILNVMSKYMAMGMTLSELIAGATWQSATAIKHPELGHLSEGAVADLAILSIRDGKFGFLDAANTKMEGTRKLECELTIRAGKVVYDLNSMASNGSAPTK